MTENYIQLKEKYTTLIKKKQQQFNTISIARLLTLLIALLAGYFYFSEKASYWLLAALTAFALFLAFVKIHQRVFFA